MTAWTDMLGGEVRYYDIAGIRTRCLEAGTGPAVVLLHARGGHAETWQKNVVPLGARFHVYAPDLVGHGFTDSWNEGYSIGDLGRFVLRFMDHIGEHSVHLVGQALGGWIAAEVALGHADRVKGLVWAAPAGLADDNAQSAPPTPYSSVSATVTALADPTLSNVRKRLAPLFHDPGILTDEMVEVRAAAYARASVGHALRAMLSTDQNPYLFTAERLSRLQVPTLIIGTESGNTPSDACKRAATAIPRGNGKFHFLERCGTWPQFERADAFNTVVSNFLEKWT